MDDKYYMRIALDLANEALESGDYGIGAIVTLDEKIIGRGRNRVVSTQNRLAHAEIEALTEASSILWDHRKTSVATLFSTYSPCPLCLSGAMIWKIKRIVYGTDLDKSGAAELQKHMPEFFQKTREPMQVTSGVLEKECIDVFMQSKKAKKLWERGLIQLE